MTQEKHTPGPWYVYSFDTNVGKTVQVKNDSGNQMHGVVCIMKTSRGNKEDNAHFIVTACNSHYELLAALEGVVRVADRKTDEFDAARVAIAKAKGE